MKNRLLFTSALSFALMLPMSISAQGIPLPEHPRPDFERSEWINLNGQWDFTFDSSVGLAAVRNSEGVSFDKKILVPFGWGSPASGVEDGADVGWYRRNISIPESWKGKRIFLVVGASDWETRVWLNGSELGTHQGGYTPFEFELTDYISEPLSMQNLVIRADDTPNNQHITGKQGYGNVRGIWQTVYLEVRGLNYIDMVHFSPDIDRSSVKAEIVLDSPASKKANVRLTFKDASQPDVVIKAGGKKNLTVDVPLKNQHLWDLDDPYLYEMTIALEEGGTVSDRVESYFGQRKISTTLLPGTDYPYVALNNKPLYLQLTLDQSYHPDGYYTFPSDEFMRNEILISKRLGLNGNRIHIKVEVPRKLYWADRLGLLVMADTPNWWDEPRDEGKKDWEHAMSQMIRRDYNHPSIFAWVNFNETWGLFTPWEGDHREYRKETQEWVRDMYHLAKNLDPTRLVEDMSPCNHDHVQSDINSWHAYLPGYGWETFLDESCSNTYPGSSWNYTSGNYQNGVPMMNSECGNVWGYDGSTGDVDITWDYHQMMNAFRAHPKCAGWLYTEHHDVINEWNGYVRFDRTWKIDGLDEFVPGMTISDFHSPYYISPRCDLYFEAAAGSVRSITPFLSVMTDKDQGSMTLETSLAGWDSLGLPVQETAVGSMTIPFTPYGNVLLDPVSVQVPRENGLYTVRFVLKGANGRVLHRNFVLIRVKDSSPVKGTVTFAPDSFVDSKWSRRQWNVMSGRKVNGAGSGYFEFEVALPEDLGSGNDALLVFEASAKQLFGKDREGAEHSGVGGDFMRGEGTHDPCRLPNSYSQTDATLFPSFLRVTVNGTVCGTQFLPDDPADHRGALSWSVQKRDKTLDEAGSYGYRVEVSIPKRLLKAGEKALIRFEVPEGVDGGLAIYGKDAGHYPLDPTLILR